MLEGQVVHHLQAPLHHLELRSGLADVAQLIADARDMRQVVVKAHQRIRRVERRQLCGQVLKGLVHFGELRVDLLVREREIEVLDVLIYAVHRGVRRADAILARDKLRFKRVDIAYQRLDLGDHLVAHGLGVHALDERLYLLNARDCAVEYRGRVGDATLERFELRLKVVEYLVYRFLEQRRAAPGADDAEQGIEILVDVVKRLDDVVGQVARDAGAGADGVAHGADGVAGIDYHFARIIYRRGGDLHQVPRLRQQVLDRAENDVQLLKLLAGVVQRVREAVRNVVRVKAEGANHGAYGVHRVRRFLNDGSVYLLLHGGLGLVGYLRRDRVFLLVFVVFYLRMAKLAAHNAEKVSGKLRRHDQCRVILAGVDAGQRLIARVEEDPAHLIVGLQALHDHLADVERQAEQLRAVVLICDGDLDVRRGGRTVGVPVGENVEPRVKRRHKAQTHDDDNCHNALAKALHIKVNYFTYLFHALSSDAPFAPSLPDSSLYSARSSSIISSTSSLGTATVLRCVIAVRAASVAASSSVIVSARRWRRWRTTISAVSSPKSCSRRVISSTLRFSSKFRYSTAMRYAATANIVAIHISRKMTFEPFVMNIIVRNSTVEIISAQSPLWIRTWFA